MPDYCFIRTLRLPISDVAKSLSDMLFREGFDVLEEPLNGMSQKIRITAYYPKIADEIQNYYTRWVIDNEDRIAASTPSTIMLEIAQSGGVEVSVVDPIKVMNASRNSKLYKYAGILRQKLMGIIHRL
jgi:hypothetical protein